MRLNPTLQFKDILMNHPSIGIVIPTLNAAKNLAHCLGPLTDSPLRPQILIIDSSSNDDTIKIAQSFNAKTVVIDRTDFNHGKTREMARRQLNTNIIVMVTQDAYAIDKDVLKKLVHPIIHGFAAVSYARQIPHDGARFFEAFPRHFNYPSISQIRSIKDVDQYGVHTFFCSNSFAAYSNKALDKIGGFPEVLLGEDTVVTALLLQEGEKIAYVSEAVVKHSHKYSLMQEFRRHFDTGLARKEYAHLLKGDKSDGFRGRTFIKQMFSQLIKEKPYLLPYACIQTFMKASGYFLGRRSKLAPIWLKKRLSAHPSYWSSSHYLKNEK